MNHIEQLEVGLKTEPFKIVVTREEAEHFADVVGDSPLAELGGHQIVPVTYPIIYWQRVDMPWLEGIGPLVHGEQSFHYDKPLLTEKEYIGQIELVKIEEKSGKLGTVIWVEHDLTGYEDENADEVIFTCKTRAMFKAEVEGQG
ncbi:hypothetical protein ACSVDE_12220 [Pseudalkalibacillus sp. Hm43]|uniref:hypothetical protein n=1 Tax=Pseudalkalibacillus sp. Hm43 TaxID=3450742 RepID=UPI003F4271B6